MTVLDWESDRGKPSLSPSGYGKVSNLRVHSRVEIGFREAAGEV